MTIFHEKDFINNAIFDIAQKIVLAARTAPKAKGIDNIVTQIITGEDIKKLSEKLYKMGEEYDHLGFIRDSQNILEASALILIGTKIAPINLKKCGLCGFGNCEGKSKHPEVPCAFNTGDLGVAIGSALSKAADYRIDNRVMYTVGQAALAMNLMGEEVKIIYAIPLSATSKNPFFDRKPTAEYKRQSDS